MSEENDRLLRPAEAAQRLGVTTKTLTRWANDGKISYVRPVGGHRRYYESAVKAVLTPHN